MTSTPTRPVDNVVIATKGLQDRNINILAGTTVENKGKLIQTISSLAHIEGITLGAGEEVDEVAGEASGMGVDGIGEVGDRASEGQAAGVFGADFTAGSLARKGARGGLRGMANKVSSDKELTEVGRKGCDSIRTVCLHQHSRTAMEKSQRMPQLAHSFKKLSVSYNL